MKKQPFLQKHGVTLIRLGFGTSVVGAIFSRWDVTMFGLTIMAFPIMWVLLSGMKV